MKVAAGILLAEEPGFQPASRLSPKKPDAFQTDTQKTSSFYGLTGVFQVYFLAVREHRLLQHPQVLSRRQDFGLSQGQNRRFDLLY